MALVGLATTASAATLVRTFDFTATNFYSLPFSGAVPYNTVSGSVIVQFDTIGGTVTDSLTGIILKNLNIPLGSPIAFDYDPSTDTLAVGGYQSGVAGVAGGTDDFVVTIYGASSATPTANILSYAVSKTRAYIFQSEDVSLALGAAPVPEPESWALLLLGVSGLGAMLRRRPRVLVTAETAGGA